MTALLVLLVLQESRDVYASDRALELRVPVSSDARHPACVVSFPEESLEALVAGWAEGDLSVERRRERLFLKLLRKAEGDLHVLGASGTLYRLTIRPVEGAYDGHVRVLAQKPRDRGAPEPVELIRAMRLGRRPSEGEIRRADEVVYQSARIAVRVAWVYETSAYRGFVARVENLSGEAERLDPSRFLARDLVLAGAREMVVPPGGRTLLYLVFWKRP